MTPMWISLITTILLRVPLAYAIAYFTRSPEYPAGRPEAIFVSLLIAWVSGAIITTIFFKRGKWREKTFVDVKKRYGAQRSIKLVLNIYLFLKGQLNKWICP